jgi:GAF domain-containing protein
VKPLQKKPLQKKPLQKKDRLSQAVVKATHEITSNSLLEMAIDKVLVLLGSAMALDKVNIYIYMVEADGMAFVDHLASWDADSDAVVYRQPALQHIPAALVPFALAVLGRNEMYAKSVRELEDLVLKNLLEGRKVKSVACLPIFVAARFWGFMSFNDCRQERDWTSTELSILQSFGVTLGAVIERSC